PETASSLRQCPRRARVVERGVPRPARRRPVTPYTVLAERGEQEPRGATRGASEDPRPGLRERREPREQDTPGIEDARCSPLADDTLPHGAGRQLQLELPARRALSALGETGAVQVAGRAIQDRNDVSGGPGVGGLPRARPERRVPREAVPARDTPFAARILRARQPIECGDEMWPVVGV